MTPARHTLTARDGLDPPVRRRNGDPARPAPQGRIRTRSGRGLPTSSPSANPVGRWKDTVPEEGLLSQIKRFVVGKPIPSHLAHHERLSRVTGLAVLSSDALSSVAYATEEILRVLILAGAAALSFASPIAFVIAAILAIVVFSYRQTIHAYPSGGGAYIVAQGQPWRDAGADRGGGAPDRLRPDRGGQHRGGRGGDHVRISRMARQPRRADARLRGRADARQPARHPRIRTDLCRADLFLHRHASLALDRGRRLAACSTATYSRSPMRRRSRRPRRLSR